MCVSTGKAGLPSANNNTIEAVFGPTPSSEVSHVLASSVGRSRKKFRSDLNVRIHRKGWLAQRKQQHDRSRLRADTVQRSEPCPGFVGGQVAQKIQIRSECAYPPERLACPAQTTTRSKPSSGRHRPAK